MKPVRGRRLTLAERRRYAAYFATEVLDAARVFDGRVPFWLRPDMDGVTLGACIHLRAGAYDPDSIDGIQLLGHDSRRGRGGAAQLIASTERATASATSMPSTPADMMPPA
jgi:hypothetical protein